MSLKQINGKVISYCEIPQELTENHWLSEYPHNCYVEVHFDENDELDDLDKWILENHPEVKDETFYIEIDY